MVSAQYISPDSLKIIIATAKEDTVRIDAMNWLSTRFNENAEIDSSKFWAKKAFEHSMKIGYKKGTGLAMLSFGNFLANEGNLSGALDYYQSAIKEFNKKNDKAYIGLAYNNIGIVYLQQEKHTESLEYIYKGLRFFMESDYELGLAQSHSLIGQHYVECRDYDEAIPHFKIAIELFKKLGEKFSLAYAYYSNGIGELDQGNFKLAVADISNARDIVKGQKNAFWFEPDYFRAIGLMYTNQGDSCKAAKNMPVAKEKYRLSEEYFLTALKKTASDNPYGIGLIYNNLGQLYFSSNKYPLARSSIEKTIQVADPLKDKRLFENSYYNLARIDSIEGNLVSAYFNIKKYMAYHEDLYNEENIRKRERYKVNFLMEKTESQVKILTAENKLKSAIASKQKQQKNIAMAGLGMLLLLSFFVFNNFLKQKKINLLAGETHAKQKAELELQGQQAVLSERLRISGELHDEVGATLSGISMYSHLVKTQLQTNNTTGIENSLQTIQQSSSQMVDKLNDIVWLINPEKDSLQQLINRLEDYAVKMAAVKDMQVTGNITGKISDAILSAETRSNIYLVCKEAINNAVKYSEASTLDFSAAEANGFLQFTIADNGRGFDNAKTSNGNGLGNMRKRAEQINAVLSVESVNGTIVKLGVKITQ